MSRALILSLAALNVFAEKVDVAEGVWNFRSDYFVRGGALNLHTHSTLIKHKDNFVMIDASDYSEQDVEDILAITEGIAPHFIHVHPFHTDFVRKAANLFPNARHFGTSRHLELIKDVNFEPILVEYGILGFIFDELEFSVPSGARLVVPNDDMTHANSVFVYHKPSKTVHVDDSFLFTKNEQLAKMFNMRANSLNLHAAYMAALIPAPQSGAKLTQWYKEKFVGVNGEEPEWSVRNVICAHLENYIPNADVSDEEAAADISRQVSLTLEDWKERLTAFDKEHEESTVRV